LIFPWIHLIPLLSFTCMRKRVVLLVQVFIYTIAVNAQYYYYNEKFYDSPVVLETGTSIGMLNALTDLGGRRGAGRPFMKDLNWSNSRPAASLYVAGTYQYAIGAKLELLAGSIQASDRELSDVATTASGRFERNLHFKSLITDIQLAIDVHPLYLLTDEAPRLSPYAVAGIGYFFFNPQAKLNGQWHPLQPLRTEGQGFAEYPGRRPYKLSQCNIPLGVGLRYELGPLFYLRLELVHRILTTDYLDDVSHDYIDPKLFAAYLPSNQATIAYRLADRKSELNPAYTTKVGDQRGNPVNNDAYFSLLLKLGLCPARLRK
jgi:hypothetical protein